MKQLGLSFQQYVQDYDGNFPTTPNQGATYGPGWTKVLFPYVKSAQIFRCPSDSNPNPSVSYGVNGLSLGFNQGWGNCCGVGGVNAEGPINEARLTTSTKTIVLFEAISGDADATGNITYTTIDAANATTGQPFADFDPARSHPGQADIAYGVAMTGQFANLTSPLKPNGNLAFVGTGRHLDGSNYLFADGHAKWLKGAVVSYGLSNSTSADCGNSSNNTAAGTGCATIGGTTSLN